ncbi:hypothetical protein, partial [Tritonibacter sp. SIMBA_163]|uniref:hypothetical protein n=1 Tax=Tritonibacter sp. SIMBA_163 TaxID=3080868 RepID=UPI00397EC411
SIMGWVVTEGGVDKEKERTKQRSAELEIIHGNNKQPERNGSSGHAGIGVLAAMVMATSVVAAGCVASDDSDGYAALTDLPPEQSYYIQLQSFNDLVATAIRAKQAGLISQQA